MDNRIIIYYIDGERKITNHHDAPKDMTRERLKEVVADYNSKHEAKAHILDVIEGSFTDYLLCRLQRAQRYTKESIEEAKRAIGEAMDALESLTPADCINCEKQRGGDASGKE